MKLAALLLTCDLVNPYHERKDQKKKKRKKRIGGIMRKRSGGTGGRSRRTAPQHRSNKTGMRGEENKIVQFGVTGESSGNNNTGNLSLSPLESFPLCQNKKDNNEIKDASVKSLSPFFSFRAGVSFFPPAAPSHHGQFQLSFNRAVFPTQLLLPFPRHTLSWRAREQFKYNIKHMAEFMERK